MFHPIIIPIFWAVIFCIVLRKTQIGMLAYLSTLINEDGESTVIYRAKMMFENVRKPFGNANVLFFIGELIIVYIVCAYISWTFMIPFVWLIGVPLGLSTMFFFVLIFVHPRNHNYIVASILVVTVVILASLFLHFFVAQSVQESVVFVAGVRNLVESNDEAIINTLEELGLTAEFVSDSLDIAQEYITENLAQNGINMTRIFMFFDNNHLNASESDSNGTLATAVIGRTDRWTALGEFNVYESLKTAYTVLTTSNIGKVFAGSIVNALAMVSTLFATFYQITLSATIFCAALFYLLVSDAFVLDHIVRLIPAQDKSTYTEAILKSINGVILGSFAISLSHSIITYTFFLILGLDFIYIATFITAFMSLFPLVSSWIVFIPMMIVLYIQGDPYLMPTGIGVIISQVFLFYFIDPYIYSMIPNAHPYLTGLSIFFGISAFGLQGVFLGPILIALTTIVYHIFSEGIYLDARPKSTTITMQQI